MSKRLQNALVRLDWYQDDKERSGLFLFAASCTDHATHGSAYEKGKEVGVKAVQSKFVKWRASNEPLVQGVELYESLT